MFNQFQKLYLYLFEITYTIRNFIRVTNDLKDFGRLIDCKLKFLKIDF